MDSRTIPSYLRASVISVGLVAFFLILYIAQVIIVPIIYSTMFAILLSPLVDFFVRHKMTRIVAIATALALVSIATILLLILFYSQVSLFTESFPGLVNKFYVMIDDLVIWTSNHFSISTQKLNSFLADTKAEILNGSKSAIGSTLSTVGGGLIVLVLIPVYVFMILFYQPLLLDFIRKVFGEANQKEVDSVLTSTKTIIQKYLVALLIEALIIGTLNSIGLLVIGIEYAILLGVMGALLNMIPYIGGIIAVSLPLLVALATKSSYTYAIWVLLLYLVIQFIDNHYVFPKIVASKVRLNALVSIIVVLSFRALWGIPGMFLSIPLVAILKVVCDHVDSLKPWGFLLGDTMPVLTIFKIKLKRKPSLKKQLEESA